jgi:hypothetical protein
MLVNSKLEILCGLRFLSIAIVYFIITQVKRSRVLQVVSKSAPLWFVLRKMVGMVREQVIRVVMLKVSRYKGKRHLQFESGAHLQSPRDPVTPSHFHGCQYPDGHERDDIMSYHNHKFLPAWHNIQDQMYSWTKNDYHRMVSYLRQI